MGRVQDKWDQAEEARQVRQKNEVCSSRLLEKLIRHHGPTEEEENDPPKPSAIVISNRIEQIKRLVCMQFGVTKENIESRSRKKGVVHPRQICMYLARKHTTHSYPEIGRRLGGRDHATILHAFHKIDGLIQQDNKTATEVAQLEAAMS